MAVRKIAIWTMTVILAVIIITGNRSVQSTDEMNSTDVIERERQVLSCMEADSLFFAKDFDYIVMYGDPRDWDDEKNMSVDMDGDGRNDLNFAISPSKLDGIRMEGRIKQKDGDWKSKNFWSSDLYRLFYNSLKGKLQARTITAKDFSTMDISGLISLLQEGRYIVKGRSMTEDDYVEISACDIDEDGMTEVLASVGNQFDENVTAVYELSFTSDTPFLYRGNITCDTFVEYKGSGILWAYRGNLKDRLYNTYLYDGKNLKKMSK